jgi:hypothetical protein
MISIRLFIPILVQVRISSGVHIARSDCCVCSCFVDYPNFDFRLSLFRLDFSNWYDEVVFLFSFYCKNETLFKRFISNHF